MPQAVIPFTRNPKSFIVTIFVIMAMVRLLFLVFGALLHRWKIVNASVKEMPFNQMAFRPWGIERIGLFTPRRGRNHSNNVELGVAEV